MFPPSLHIFCFHIFQSLKVSQSPEFKKGMEKSIHPRGAANVQHVQEISSNSSNKRENAPLFPNAAMSMTNGPFSTSRAAGRESESGWGSWLLQLSAGGDTGKPLVIVSQKTAFLLIVFPAKAFSCYFCRTICWGYWNFTFATDPFL